MVCAGCARRREKLSMLKITVANGLKDAILKASRRSTQEAHNDRLRDRDRREDGSIDEE